MTTTHTPRRIQRSRQAGWRAPLDPQGRTPVYVGRGGRWGNPYRAAVHTRHGASLLLANLLAVRGGLAHIRDHVVAYPSDDEIRAELHGRDLMCWCPLPEPGQPDHCHGAVLLALANPAPAVPDRRPDTRAYATPEPGCPGLRCSDCEPGEECCEATCGPCPQVDAQDHCRLAPGSEDDSRYCDQHGEGWLEPISDARVAQSVRDQPDESRYFIGRDGVFATPYDRLLAAGATPGPDNGGAA